MLRQVRTKSRLRLESVGAAGGKVPGSPNNGSWAKKIKKFRDLWSTEFRDTPQKPWFYPCDRASFVIVTVTF
jgi:hypothetical protein